MYFNPHRGICEKQKILNQILFITCLKHMLWIFIKTALIYKAVLISTHNIYILEKLMKSKNSSTEPHHKKTMQLISTFIFATLSTIHLLPKSKISSL